MPRWRDLRRPNTPVTVTNNAIRLNAATRGGGVAILQEDLQPSTGTRRSSFPQQHDHPERGELHRQCTGQTNSAPGSGGGLWTYTETDNLQITGNTISSNVANSAGGGLSIGRVAKNFQLLNNTLQANVAASTTDAYGGCIRLRGET